MRRRTIIRTVGSIAGLSAVSSTVLGAKPDESQTVTDFKSIIIDRYGKKEGSRIINIALDYYNKLEKGKIEQGEFNNRVTNEILNSTGLEGIKEDIVSSWSRKPPHHQIRETTWAIRENTDTFRKFGEDFEIDNENEEWVPASSPSPTRSTSTTEASTTISSTDTISTTSSYPRWERFVSSEASGGDSGGGSGASAVDPIRWCDSSIPQCFENDGVLRARASSLLYGSAWYYARGFVGFSPNHDGDHTITVQYFLDGNADTGTTKLSLFARRHSDGAMNAKIIDEPVTVVNDDRSRYKQFNLNTDESYDLGVELYCQTNSAGSANSADYYSSDDANGYRAARIRKHDDESRSMKIDIA